MLVWCNHGNKQVEDIIEARARSLDITTAEACYNILYCYHICRSNYRKGMCFLVVPLSLLIANVDILFVAQLSLLLAIIN